MEKIIVKEGSNVSTIFLDSTTYYGYTINNQSIIPCIEDLSSIFSFFSLSKNHSPFQKEGKYDVCTDYSSGFKHYFINGKEDFYSFFIQNGTSTTVYKGDKTPFNLNDLRFFSSGEKVVICSFIACLLISGMTPNLVRSYQVPAQDVIVESIQDYTLEQIRDYIYSSPFLSIEEKNFLYNPEYLSLVIDTVNQSNVAKNNFSTYFHNISIEPLILEEDNKGPSGGRYKLSTPSTLYVSSYKELNDGNKDTVAHEYVHLCQDTTGYDLIIESCAEIISHEFFGHNTERSYYSQVKLVKKLMEIIGTDAIWYYNFTGDFSKIEEQVRPYLSEDEYCDFLDTLTFDYVNHMENRPKEKRFQELLEIMYQNKYHEDMKDNPIFEYIDMGGFHLHRYYFNPALKSESYYLDYENGSYQTMSCEEAMEADILQIYAVHKTPITQEEAFQLLDSDDCIIDRDIRKRDHDISILRSKYSASKLVVSVIIEGVRYDDVDIDDLVREGLLEVDYSKVQQKTLSYEDFVNHNYWEDATILFGKASDTTFHDGMVEAFIPMKIILPPVGETNNNNQNMVYYKA